MIGLTVTCTACGTGHTPSHDAYVRGTWRTCTRCRDGPDDQVSRVIEDDSSALQGHLTITNCQAEFGKDNIMATKPTTAQIRDRAERRMRELGYVKPEPGALSYEARLKVWDERFARQVIDAEMFPTRVYELDQEREDAAEARDQAAYDAQIDLLRTNYLAQPGTTDADFEHALPRLLARQREAATLAGSTEFERATQVARASGRYAI